MLGIEKKNFAVFEFKSSRYGIGPIEDDLEKLQEFIEGELNYQMGILVIFGEKNEFEYLQEELRRLTRGVTRKLKILFYDLKSREVNDLKAVITEKRDI
nr:hypothetical protein [Candidatus Freyarchaeota archaeon]